MLGEISQNRKTNTTCSHIQDLKKKIKLLEAEYRIVVTRGWVWVCILISFFTSTLWPACHGETTLKLKQTSENELKKEREDTNRASYLRAPGDHCQ